METNNNKIYPIKNDEVVEVENNRINSGPSSEEQSKHSLYISSLIENNNQENNKMGNMTYFCEGTRVCGNSPLALLTSYVLIIVPSVLFYIAV